METREDIAEWRKARRAELLARRQSIAPDDRRIWNDAITRFLIERFPFLRHMTIGFCWPFKGEFDARFAIRHFRDGGARAALPVVVTKDAPLQFREWWPGAATSPGVFGLPVPQATEVVSPDALLIPPVGFAPDGYRLGYGGGYFDRTLASMSPQPLKMAVAFEVSGMPTIHPQRHDIRMDFIVTEQGIHHVGAAGLTLIDDPAKVHAIAANRVNLHRANPA
jgi:5,10-methenyltetrahydrofolate synthetase